MITDFSLMNGSNTILMVCDIQEKFKPGMPKFNQVSKVAIRAIEFAKMMDFCILKSEQYPKGLGKTDKGVQETLKFTKPEHEFEDFAT